MSIIAGSLRAFWAPGLNAITGNVTKGVSAWILDEDYQIYTPLQANYFILSFPTPDHFLNALAADVNRFAAAAIETACQEPKNEKLPRSIAWLVIKSYYAAFFAAHAISRMLGIVHSQFDKTQANSVNRIASAFGMSNGQTIGAGYYSCTYSHSARHLECMSVNARLGGVHEMFWNSFQSIIRKLSNDAINSGTGRVADNQLVSSRLSDLAENLAYKSSPNGNWLSNMRNLVNYRHRFGTWYPYSGQPKYFSTLSNRSHLWLSDPMSIDLANHGDKDLSRFLATCSFLVATCRSLVWEMGNRCPEGKSFHSYGSIMLLNLITKSTSRRLLKRIE
jgi:hypothetical protein